MRRKLIWLLSQVNCVVGWGREMASDLATQRWNQEVKTDKIKNNMARAVINQFSEVFSAAGKKMTRLLLFRCALLLHTPPIASYLNRIHHISYTPQLHHRGGHG
mmetsp:Transcript_13035/g.26443  ORF Transcript_13035/g.26443 Transcript_13035/m.26443 type:complete len:104 (+) Transcript_13035:177-488(+)